MQREHIVAFFLSDKRVNVLRVHNIYYALRYIRPQAVLYAQHT
jgi:hypothetical protein